MRIRALPAVLVAVSAAAAALGAKLWLIRDYGSDVPYMDQWVAQGELLYIPRAEHRLMAKYFYWPHNEHHVLFTRLINYALTIANRQWDPLLEMSVNALLHAGLALALLLLARKHLRGAAFAGAAVVATALFALPFAWENTLEGFQSQFYLLAWSALGTLWLCLGGAPLGLRWWAGIVVGIAGLGTMSSSFVAPAAVIAVMALQALCGRPVGLRGAGAAAGLALLAAAGIYTIHPVPADAAYRAASVGSWLGALGEAMAWPIRGWPLCAVLVQAPLAVFIAERLKARSWESADSVLAGLGIWSWLQMAVLAYGRGNLGMIDSSRYFDLYAIGAIANGIALARLISDARSRTALAAAAAWAVLVAGGLRAQTLEAYRDYLDGWPAIKATERALMRAYTHSGDPAVFGKVPQNLWPLPSLDDMVRVLSHPGVRPLLPVSIRPELALSPSGDSQGFAAEAPDDLPGKPDVKVWTAEHGPARFVSRPLPAGCLPVLRFELAGSAGLPGSVLRLRSESGAESRASVPRLAGDRWQAVQLPLPPGGGVRVVADLPAGAGWFAFSPPAEMGLLSWYDHYVIKGGCLLFWIGACGLAASAAAISATEPFRKADS